ncbi:MAG TPA: hypothetical protein ENK85_01975 [Saprospiraceae bacterium]|nr:hypothetical protein [Saprospiraceae bacterium]
MDVKKVSKLKLRDPIEYLFLLCSKTIAKPNGANGTLFSNGLDGFAVQNTISSETNDHYQDSNHMNSFANR